MELLREELVVKRRPDHPIMSTKPVPHRSVLVQHVHIASEASFPDAITRARFAINEEPSIFLGIISLTPALIRKAFLIAHNILDSHGVLA